MEQQNVEIPAAQNSDVIGMDVNASRVDDMSIGSPSLAPDAMDVGDLQDIALLGLDDGMDLTSCGHEGVAESGKDFFNQWTDVYETDFSSSVFNKRCTSRRLVRSSVLRHINFVGRVFTWSNQFMYK